MAPAECSQAKTTRALEGILPVDLVDDVLLPLLDPKTLAVLSACSRHWRRVVTRAALDTLIRKPKGQLGVLRFLRAYAGLPWNEQTCSLLAAIQGNLDALNKWLRAQDPTLPIIILGPYVFGPICPYIFGPKKKKRRKTASEL